MKKILRYVMSGIVLAGSFAPSGAQGVESDPLTLYGVKRYNISGANSGLYSIEVTPGAQPQLVWADGDMIGNAGSVYADGTLYVLSYLEFMGITAWGYQVCDVEAQTYDFSASDDLVLRRDVAGCLTYDPSTNVIYAVCLADETGANFDLCAMDKATGIKTHLYRLPRRVFTLAATADGEIYGVADDGVLYQISKYNGDMSPIGSTGLIPTADQCAVIDYETNVMYWCAYTEAGGGLYTTDITTGTTVEVTHFDDGWQFSGIFLKQVAQAASAPQGVDELTAIFEGASLSGNLEFVLPTKDIQGQDLKSDVSYSITLSGSELASGSGAPGEKITASVTVPAAGSHCFVVTALSNGMAGLAANTELWVGMDTPKAVTDCKLTLDGEVVTTTWELPERGVNGGYVDHSKVRYVIERGPEELIVSTDCQGTTFVETVHRNGVYPVMYRITPYIDELKGEGVITDWIRVGGHFEPPFTIDFNDPFNSLVVDVIDANGDRCTWRYDRDYECMLCEWPISSDFKRDDWMITVPVSLTEGLWYEIGANVASQGKWDYEAQQYVDTYAGELALYVGREPSVGAMTDKVVDYEIVESMEFMNRSAAFMAPETGMYYIGVHLRGGIDRGNIYDALVRSISVSSGSGIESVEADSAQFSAVAVGGGISIANPTGAAVRVVSIAGQVVAATSEPQAMVSLRPGIYVVTSGSHTVKIVVR